MKEVRVAIIGCGMISHRHMQIYQNINSMADRLGFRAKVVACAGRSPERLKAWGERYHFAEKDLYLDYRELLKRDDIDTIDVCVHNNLHVPICIEVMKAGFDCYCEKPAAASWHDMNMMIDCAEKLGRKFHAQMSSVMTPQSRDARDMVRSGAIGTPYFVNLENCTNRRRPGYDLWDFSPDFYAKSVAGHGTTIDLGVYLIGQILFILDLPELESVSGFAVQGMGDIDPKRLRRPEGFTVEDFSSGLAKFKNGMGFHILFSSAFNFNNYSQTYILGSKGGLELKNTDMAGGLLAMPNMRRMWGEAPSVTFHGEVNGRLVDTDLKSDYNDGVRNTTDPMNMIYNDNQIMWLAYKLGIIGEAERYNTPAITRNMLLLTDGIFLSQELGRSVTAEEIKELSPALYLKGEDLSFGHVDFDLDY